MSLNPDLYNLSVEQIPTRKGYGEGLLEAGKIDSQIVALCADLTESTQTHLFAREFPNRFVQIGVAEQNLATVASGMASMGKIPFITSYAMFSPGRNWEQIRTTICYNDQNVKVIGSHSGVSVGPDGGTHQAIEDIAIMRVIPRMTVVTPCDVIEAKKATLAIAKHKGPVYMRLTREKTPIITTMETEFTLGKANVLIKPNKPQVAIFASGPLVYNALMAARKLKTFDIDVSVTNVHTIKPLDQETIINQAKLAGKVVTVEEHQVAGGLGSAIAEVLVENYPVPMRFIGVRDLFGQSGSPNELIEYYGMGIDQIIKTVQDLVKN